MAKLDSVKDLIINALTQLGGIATAIIVGLALLVGIITGVYFLKKDQRGSEEGKGGLMRVGTTIIVAVGASVIFSAFAAFVTSVIQ
ncbi:MAG: hypothetical protein LBT37_06090 [Lactobacillaceae bacterium]|jgi:hypothetical protein|nr:hypothetical protein [Lactobacillaceae bacterium]